MFNHEADESVNCDNCCYYKQNHHYCMFVLFHISLFKKYFKHRIYCIINNDAF